MKIVVASKNPVKLAATKLGFQSFFPQFCVEGVQVPSGVSDQPMTDEETLRGATNRAYNARQFQNDADFWIGIEGGLHPDGSGFSAFAWIVILSANRQGEARTTSFLLPLKVVRLIKQGIELGEANDIVFKKNNSKQKNGAVGLLTKNEVSRTELYKQAVQLALIPFVNPDLY